MARATWNGVVLAESGEGVVIEGNYYFPREAVKSEFFRPSQTHTTCHWKGSPATTISSWTGRRIRMRLGPIPTQVRRRSRSETTSPSGEA